VACAADRSRVLLTNLLSYAGASLSRSRRDPADNANFGRGVLIHEPGRRPSTEGAGEAEGSGGKAADAWASPPHYCSNSISTTEYSVLTFLPKALYEQFRRVANLYFLFGAILSLTPLSPYQAASLIALLILVVGLPMTKEAFEDWRRRQAVRSPLRIPFQYPIGSTVCHRGGACLDGSQHRRVAARLPVLHDALPTMHI